MRSKCKLLRALLILGLLLGASAMPTFACQIKTPKRNPTVAEQMAGLSTIFGGTVIGWQTDSGEMLIGQMPAACVQKDSGHYGYGGYDWDSASTPMCEVYQYVKAALFRVDTSIVGPEAGAIITVYATWGDGDCAPHFKWGEQWFIAGKTFEGRIHSSPFSNAAQQLLIEPIRADEIAALRKMAAEAEFDFDTLFK